jgi:hypothetical protein
VYQVANSFVFFDRVAYFFGVSFFHFLKVLADFFACELWFCYSFTGALLVSE